MWAGKNRLHQHEVKFVVGSLWKTLKGRVWAPWKDDEREVRGRVQAEIAPSSGHAEHPLCARGDVEKGSFWRHRRRCLIWMQLIRKVDWFDGTSGAWQRSALVCEGVHAQVDIYAFQGSFNNNIKGSMKKPRLLFFLYLSSRTQSTHNYTNPFQINFCLLPPRLCRKYLVKHRSEFGLQCALVSKSVDFFLFERLK